MSSEATLAIDESLMRTIIAMTDRLQKNYGDYNMLGQAWPGLLLSGYQAYEVCIVSERVRGLWLLILTTIGKAAPFAILLNCVIGINKINKS